jgi:hypothetical protein
MRVLILMVALLTPTRALATVILPADFSTVVNGADVIVSGRVVDIRSQLTDRRSIESFVTVVISETLKGTPASSITFRVPNGTVGRYRRITVGAPEFAQGDRVILFLRARAPVVPTLFGLSQGVYRVAATDAGEVVLPAPMMARGIGAERVVRGDPARRTLPLAEFLTAVRASMVRR